MSTLIHKAKIFARRKARIRAKVSGTTDRPRLAIFKSNRFIYAQIIDDASGHTMASFDSQDSKAKTPVDSAREVGLGIAKKATAAGIHKVVFDRGGYLYAGKIKVVADAAREGGLEF